MIISTRLWWRPPSKLAFSHSSTIIFASSLPTNACTKRENVGVVMHSGKFCGVRLAADTCADAFYLVGS